MPQEAPLIPLWRCVKAGYEEDFAERQATTAPKQRRDRFRNGSRSHIIGCSPTGACRPSKKPRDEPLRENAERPHWHRTKTVALIRVLPPRRLQRQPPLPAPLPSANALWIDWPIHSENLAPYPFPAGYRPNIIHIHFRNALDTPPLFWSRLLTLSMILFGCVSLQWPDRRPCYFLPTFTPTAASCGCPFNGIVSLLPLIRTGLDGSCGIGIWRNN